ncbi:hypothetical protein [Campylobacter devanensis]|uniref:hypothetical protein n=1 Tax=Campylobacter devanensis TaxID=3161138 RepID=UPI000A33DC1B|nr:hypothetical protein [Campylobacter sp. P031]
MFLHKSLFILLVPPIEEPNGATTAVPAPAVAILAEVEVVAASIPLLAAFSEATNTAAAPATRLSLIGFCF